MPPFGWIQGPNAVVFHNGKYHLFYGYDPKNVGRFLCEPHWGHASTENFLHWEHHQVAVSPSINGPDRNGCWSGSVVINDGVPTIIYSGLVKKSFEVEDRVSCLTQCFATGSKDMVHWQKSPSNPILIDPPEEYRDRLNAWHDPYIWREGDIWYMLLGCAYKNWSGGLVLLYQSHDLVDWEYLHPFCEGMKTGERWLDPNFFPLGDRHVLLYVEPEGPMYLIGDYRNQRFYPETGGIIDQGPQFDSGATVLDQNGRRLLFGWISEDRPIDSYIDEGWAGVVSLPRVIDIQDGVLTVDVAQEVRASSTPNVNITNLELTPSTPITIEHARGNSMEIEVEFDLSQSDEVGLRLCRSPGGEEETIVSYNKNRHALVLDRSRSSLDPRVGRTVDDTSLYLSDEEHLKLTVFVDRSVVEIFGNNRVCLTGRIYPTKKDSLDMGLFTKEGTAMVNNCRVWRRESIW